MKFYLTIIFTIFFIACYSQSSKDTEIWEPIPKKVYSISDSAPPNDAIVLFDGTDLSNWEGNWDDKESEWMINDDGFLVNNGNNGPRIQTKENFGSVQLHIEWKTSEDLSHKNQSRSNSGVFLQSRYEIQILDSYENQTLSLIHI